MATTKTGSDGDEDDDEDDNDSKLCSNAMHLLKRCSNDAGDDDHDAGGDDAKDGNDDDSDSTIALAVSNIVV